MPDNPQMDTQQLAADGLEQTSEMGHEHASRPPRPADEFEPGRDFS